MPERFAVAPVSRRLSCDNVGKLIESGTVAESIDCHEIAFPKLYSVCADAPAETSNIKKTNLFMMIVLIAKVSKN